MAMRPFTAVAQFLTTILVAIVGVAHAAPTITVPIRVHIVRDLVMPKDGLSMSSWVTEEQVRDVILPEVNRIWRAADIAFRLEAVGTASTRRPPDFRERVDAVVTARRDIDGESDPERIRHLGELIGFASAEDGTVDVYLVPYLGEASQGNTKRSLRRVFVAQWTDASRRCAHGRRSGEGEAEGCQALASRGRRHRLGVSPSPRASCSGMRWMSPGVSFRGAQALRTSP